MQSFRTELEDLNNPIVEQDILDLERKIAQFKEGTVDEEKFRSLRLARGVYGQRQQGVQMIRIKVPYGKISTKQLRHIADLSDEYASSTLHATTRQDIQIHYVSLDRTPELWTRLEQEKITLREACGNTVRNVTASASAGIDPEEPFDVSPYAQAIFEYFLRNPICQEMGRKFKIALSSSAKDSAFAFIHDVGLIPKIQNDLRGFEVLIGGGLGAQPYMAEKAYDFLEEDKIIPFIEGLLRVFDRFGERKRRTKARFKFLLQELGLQEVLRLIEEERPALKNKVVKINGSFIQPKPKPFKSYDSVQPIDPAKYALWRRTNTFEQKQNGFYGVYLKLLLGNLSSDQARTLADIVDEFAADDVRITINQGYLLKFVRPEALPALFNALNAEGFAEPGFDRINDIVACPGTDTCNLGISSSTGAARVLEQVITKEYPELIADTQLKIKISGCPNSCAQHGIASIGFHGSSQKNPANKLVFPALQVLLGGGFTKEGKPVMAEKVIKVPTKRAPQVLRVVFEDYDVNRTEGEYFADYFRRQEKMYFYQLLKPLSDLTDLQETDYVDWHHDEKFAVFKAVGECAGVIIDLVSTLLYEAEEKFGWAEDALAKGNYADAIYHSYNTFVSGAKALLLSENAKVNTQMSILREFDTHFTGKESFQFDEGSFKDHVLKMRSQEPEEAFAKEYLKEAQTFLELISKSRAVQLADAPAPVPVSV